MKIKQLLALFCFLLFALSGFAQTKEAKRAEFEWEKIIPLVTKKAEVENYFGKPSKGHTDTSIFDTNSGKIFVYYRGLEVSERMPDKCNISRDTVITLGIDLTKAIPIEELGWELDKFNKTLRNDGVYVYAYMENGIGIYLSVFNGQDGKELVSSIGYQPSYLNIKNKCIMK